MILKKKKKKEKKERIYLIHEYQIFRISLTKHVLFLFYTLGTMRIVIYIYIVCLFDVKKTLLTSI